MTSRLPTLALTLLASIAPGGAAASDVKEKKPLVFGSEVSLVQVPVFVSGKGGGAQTGLRAEDFIVDEDGKPVEVVSFRYVDTTSAADQEAIRAASPARRRFLLLFDKSFTDPAGLARARKDAKEFVLRHLAESDLVAVATFDFMRGIRLVANFTEDRRVVEHAIHTLGIPSLSRISDPLALAADVSFTDITSERDNVSSGDTPSVLIADVIAALAARARSAEEQLYRARVITLLDSFEQLGRSLRRIDGRKQIVYFSTGFSSFLLHGQDKVDQTRTSEAIVAGRIWEVDSDARYGDTRMRSIIQDALRHLARADAVVHAVDLGGLGTKEEYNQLPAAGMPTRDAGGRDSLATIAAETGGRFFKDANNLVPVLREMADMTSRYYVLGVQPLDRKNESEGEFRKLRVRVKPRGLRVSHRPGFFARGEAVAAAPPAPALQRQFEAAEMILSGEATAGARALDFRALVVPVPRDAEKQELGIVVQIPRASLPVTDGPVEVYGYAIGADGAVADHFAHFLRVDASRVGEAVEGLSFAGRFTLAPGPYTLRLLAQRPDSGEMGMKFYEVSVPRREASAGFLLPPLFIADRTRWVEVAVRSGVASAGGAAAPASGLPFDLDLSGSPFLPTTEAALRPGQKARVVLISYEPDRARDPALDVDIRTVLSDDAGRNFAPGLVTVEKVHHTPDGRRSYVLSLTPEASLAPGDYTLRMRVGEGASVLQSFCRLRILPKSAASND